MVWASLLGRCREGKRDETSILVHRRRGVWCPQWIFMLSRALIKGVELPRECSAKCLSHRNLWRWRVCRLTCRSQILCRTSRTSAHVHVGKGMFGYLKDPILIWSLWRFTPGESRVKRAGRQTYCGAGHTCCSVWCPSRDLSEISHSCFAFAFFCCARSLNCRSSAWIRQLLGSLALGQWATGFAFVHYIHWIHVDSKTTDQIDMGELPQWSCVAWNSAVISILITKFAASADIKSVFHQRGYHWQLGVFSWWPFVLLFGARCWKGALRRTTVSGLMRPHRWLSHQTDFPGASRRSCSLEIAGGLKSILVLRHRDKLGTFNASNNVARIVGLVYTWASSLSLVVTPRYCMLPSP